MRSRWLVLIGAVVLSGAAGAWWATRPRHYVTTPAVRQDVERYVVTTGNVNPVATVQLGARVPGPIKAIFCDFNTQVRAGQLCAKVEPRSYQVARDQARASLASAQAQLAKDRAGFANSAITYRRDRGLLDQGIVSREQIDIDRSGFDQAAAQVQLDEAAVLERKGALEAAEAQLQYTDILSPVDGTVVSRNVNAGQTVAAGIQPQPLFLIAQDMTRMQVDTNVSESDVGGLRVGQRAALTVNAYPTRSFDGTVIQIRQAPIPVQNVVTYDAVIGVSNPQLLLFPGMTATVRIVTEERRGVLAVPLQALQFSPRGATHDAGDQLWVERDGRVEPVAVTVGLRGANAAEITGGALTPGERVIVGETGTASRGPVPAGVPILMR